MAGVSSANINVNHEFAPQVCGLGCMQVQTVPCDSTNVARDERSIHIIYINSVKNSKCYFAKCELWILIQRNKLV